MSVYDEETITILELNSEVPNLLEKLIYNMKSVQNSGICLFKYNNKFYEAGDFSVRESIEETEGWNSEEEYAIEAIENYIYYSGKKVTEGKKNKAIEKFVAILKKDENWRSLEV